jgi:hypothetical protein
VKTQGSERDQGAGASLGHCACPPSLTYHSLSLSSLGMSYIFSLLFLSLAGMGKVV